MGRPRTTDRASVKDFTLTLKLTTPERERLRELVAQREAELAQLTGQRIELSASAFLRWLMDDRARSVGLGAPTTKETPRPPKLIGRPLAKGATRENREK